MQTVVGILVVEIVCVGLRADVVRGGGGRGERRQEVLKVRLDAGGYCSLQLPK